MPRDRIIIRGAREHNLKNIDLDLPRDKLIVITGLSGSGKSSLAFDTIYAEGERRYVESLSTYARQFLGQMDKPDVDYIEGLSPAVSIDQKTTSHNPRSTVATVTEIYDYLRLLFARVGVPHCPQCGKAIARQSVDQIVDQVMSLPEGTRLHVLAPLVRGRKGEYRQIFEEVRRKGFVRVRVNGVIYDVNGDLNHLQLARYKQHHIEVVVDRIVLRPDVQSRLADSVQTALQLGQSVVMIEVVDAEGSGWREKGSHGEEQPTILTFSESFACPDCGVSLEEIAPRSFSFNSPYGACKACDGLGMRHEFDPQLIVPDPNLSLAEGAIVPWRNRNSDYKWQALNAVAQRFGFTLHTPWRQLSAAQQHVVLYGTEGETLRFTFRNYEGRIRTVDTEFEGVIPSLQREYQDYNDEWREVLQKFMSAKPCPACHGARLKPESLAVTIRHERFAEGGRGKKENKGKKGNAKNGANASSSFSFLPLPPCEYNIADVTALSVGDALRFFETLELSEREMMIARQVLKEIRARLKFLVDVGLDYLTLDRSASTLAGGEAQRIRLATQIGSGLVGVLYILDEPSIGLHQRDNVRLLRTLCHLRDLGNTVIVVEHDEETIRTADYIVDIGPGAGEHGGRVVVAGTLEDVMNCPHSLTGDYLSGRRRIAPRERRRSPNGQYLVVKGARQHNLKNIDVQIPLGVFVCITGVSGSGKSTLLQDILYNRLANKIHGAATVWGAHDDILGVENVDKVINIDQSPIGRTPRSNPATYTGTFTPIRELFSRTREARARGYKPGRFSFNVKGGRCEACQGDGMIKIEMHFLPDVYVPCEVCKGKRYNRETLEVKYKDKNIADVLDMTVEEALHFFENIPPIQRKLQTLFDVGLGYIKLGQPATTLSGGEAQRVKLAEELSRRPTGHTLYILDEPTTGLHFEDVRRLLDVLHRLTDQGNTVIVIEHNLEVIKTADWIIDLGPEGGAHGGWVIATGTPEEVAQNERSYTGQFLKKVLAV
ncbi:MAG: excinuclease ABC subunit UvrA [Abditibacteriales bacterium]|nr:excinuclease ABC subunit UvrA [Abditibacteriales bacterium]MDW8366845.1 excinuclease ABC subunit UvrA [Abditibacteriales bacterium]